ncbi:MAG: AgmX/PglI C-terminal domain-containing protein [Myxococcales bacterium]|nr:AgmX/PglI C-terminal domain-containing protein [Myxococcales bacterium]
MFALSMRAPMDPSEVERSEGLVLEVTVRWGDRLVRVQHLAVGERFTLGRRADDRVASMCIDARELPDHDARFVLAAHDGSALVARLPAEAHTTIDGDADALVVEHEVDGVRRVALALGALVRVTLGGLEFSFRAVRAPRRAVRRGAMDRAFSGALLGAVVALGVTASLVYGLSAPQSELLADTLLDERDATIRHWVARQREWSLTERTDAPGAAQDSQPNGRAPGPAGATGAFEAPRRITRSAVRDRGLVPQLARTRARELVETRGIFAALGAPSDARETRAPESPFGGLLSSGADARDAWGSSDVGDVADGFGYGGLGRLNSGAGPGGGGSGAGGTCGVDSCDAGIFGHGMGSGAMLRARRAAIGALRPIGTRGPIVRAAPIQVGGTYSREVVRRVIQRNMGQVQHCFEQALSRNRDATGRVMVRFVIAADGRVAGANATENTTGDALLGACIAGAFRRWQFPSPDGIVTVSYPILLRVD